MVAEHARDTNYELQKAIHGAKPIPQEGCDPGPASEARENRDEQHIVGLLENLISTPIRSSHGETGLLLSERESSMDALRGGGGGNSFSECAKLRLTLSFVSTIRRGVEQYYVVVAGQVGYCWTGPEYCQIKRKVPGQQESQLMCRLDYPMTGREAGVGFDSKKRILFEPQRNDPLLNTYNRAKTLGWRADIDVKSVMSTDAAINQSYIAKYASKSEPAFPQLLDNVVAGMNEAGTAKSACQKMLNKNAPSRPKKQLDCYWASHCWVNNQWRKRRDRTDVVLRVFPIISPEPGGDQYEAYCRTKSLSTIRSEVNGEMWVRCRAAGHVHPLDTLRCWKKENKSIEEDEEDDDEDVPNADRPPNNDDWQVFAQAFPNAPVPQFELQDIGTRPIDDGWDLEAAHGRWDHIEQIHNYLHQ
ncbi:hypothetical protein R3P38DRAFT_2788170 [Favolaschia claudopus]|uniref:Uncharacterized protein n=1 Tax=Favolaschia claudopus TaxID=2862362 RepID=A0AAW0AMG6_9AGAR